MKNLIKKLLSLIIACSCSFSLLACLDTNPQKCSHSWSEANCKFPQTCNLCQETRGTVSDHNYKNGACITCGEADPKVKQLDLGKTAYQNLNLLSSYCSIMAKSIYRAWYFAIYKADNSSYLLNPKLGIDQYAKDTMLGSDLIIQSIDKYLETLNLNSSNDIIRLSVLATNSGAVNVVIIAYEIGNITKNMDEALNKAKTALEKMSNEYDNITEYSTLKNYYSDTLAFYNFVKSPSGNFTQFTPTITNYETKTNQHKSQLGFIYKTK